MASTEGAEPAYSSELLRSIEAPQASVFDCIALLIPTASSVALQFRLCQRILHFPLDQVAFWLPELVHVFVTFETESAALEDLLLRLSHQSTHCALSVFWHLQSALHDLKDDPHSFGFVAARRLSNKMQHMLFAAGELPQETVMHDNPQPAMIMAGMIGAAVGMPRLGKHMKPLLESQGRKQRSAYLIRQAVSKLLPGGPRGGRPPLTERATSDSVPRVSASPPPDDSRGAFGSRSAQSSAQSSPQTVWKGGRGHAPRELVDDIGLPQLGLFQMGSQPNLTFQHPDNSGDGLAIISHNKSMPALLGSGRKDESPVGALKSNYFRCETQFVYALNAISVRLLQVPKEARQSALQIELALLNEDLPHAEVDLPMLLPQRHGKQNRIVRICVNEATVLNSAEKAPFLLLIEYLRGDLTFDPQQTRNREILRADPKLKTHIFERPALPLSRSASQPPPSLSPDEAFNTSSDTLTTGGGSGGGARHSTTSPQVTSFADAPRLSSPSSPGGASRPGEQPGTPQQQQSKNEQPHRRLPEQQQRQSSPLQPQPLQLQQQVAHLHMNDELELDISEVSLLEREESSIFDVKGLASSGAGGSGLRTMLPMAETELSAATHVRESRQFAEGPSAADLATQWRTASLILTQLDGSTKLPKQEVQSIRQRIVDSMRGMQTSPRKAAAQAEAGERRLENDLKTSGLASEEVYADHHDDDPSAANLGEDWQSRKARIRRASKFGDHPNWDLVSVIVKTGDDLRQEALASQLIQRAAQIWKANGVDVWVRRMMILITSANSGLVETITNALSLHSIKKALTTAQVNDGGDPRSIAQLKQHFELKFGGEQSHQYQRAVRNFVKSLAAYSVLCYILQIKDRHNGNILVDAEGHIIHIDFGFMLSNSPGHIGFEANTFKLTQEYVDLMGGIGSENWQLFVGLLIKAFLAMRNQRDEFINFMQIMGTNSTLPCFSGNVQATAQQLRVRFMPDLPEQDAAHAFERLIWKSYGSYYTRLYDQYQLVTQGIYS